MLLNLQKRERQDRVRESREAEWKRGSLPAEGAPQTDWDPGPGFPTPASLRGGHLQLGFREEEAEAEVP